MAFLKHLFEKVNLKKKSACDKKARKITQLAKCFILKILHEYMYSCFTEFIKKLMKRDKMQGWPSILSLFPNKFTKFNNTRAQMIDSIYITKLRLL